MTSKGKFPEITWEEDDTGFVDESVQRAAAADDAAFAELLGRAPQRPAQRLIAGEKIKGVIAMLPHGSGDILVDIGGKRSALIEKSELAGEGGDLKVKVGDPIEAFVVSTKGGEILLSFRQSQTLKSLADLDQAFARKMPVRGKVAKVNKGGFEVLVLGKAAFCPVSQMDTRRVETPESYIGQEFEFLIEKLEEKGRNIVLSRAALLRAQAEVRIRELTESLQPDTILDGTVTEVRDFGAFVDIGGVDGLVHVSELSHARVSRPQDVVAPGDKVRVRVLRIEKDDKGRPKLALSIKGAAQDPWDDIHAQVEGGKNYTGRVVNLMPFGAFVEIKPGIEGLVHVSEMSWIKRIHHPSDVLTVGDAVTVQVKEIDPVKRRIALTMKQVEDDPWFDVVRRFPAGAAAHAKVDKLKAFGALVELAPGLSGLLPMGVIKRKFGEAYKQPCTPGKELEVRIVQVDSSARKVLLTLVGVEEQDDDQKHYLEYLAAEKEREQAQAAQARQDRDQASSGERMGSLGALLSAKLQQGRKG